MEKKTYEKLELDVVRFDEEDVITTSGEPACEYNCPNDYAVK